MLDLKKKHTFKITGTVEELDLLFRMVHYAQHNEDVVDVCCAAELSYADDLMHQIEEQYNNLIVKGE